MAAAVAAAVVAVPVALGPLLRVAFFAVPSCGAELLFGLLRLVRDNAASLLRRASPRGHIRVAAMPI